MVKVAQTSADSHSLTKPYKSYNESANQNQLLKNQSKIKYRLTAEYAIEARAFCTDALIWAVLAGEHPFLGALVVRLARVAVGDVVDHQVVARLAESLPRRLQLVLDERDRVRAEGLPEEGYVHRLQAAEGWPDPPVYTLAQVHSMT